MTEADNEKVDKVFQIVTPIIFDRFEPAIQNKFRSLENNPVRMLQHLHNTYGQGSKLQSTLSAALSDVLRYVMDLYPKCFFLLTG